MTYSKYYWLNEQSRKFLSRGYFEESAEQRIKDIEESYNKVITELEDNIKIIDELISKF